MPNLEHIGGHKINSIPLPSPQRANPTRCSRHLKTMQSIKQAFLWVVLFLAAVAPTAALAGRPPAYPPTNQHTAGGVIVKVREGFLASPEIGAEKSVNQVHGWAASAGAKTTRALWPVTTTTALSTVPGNEIPALRTYLVTPESGISTDEVVRRLEALPWVEWAEADRLFELHAVPSDALYSRQWDLENTGQSYWSVARVAGNNNDTLASLQGTPGADVRFRAVYDHSGPKAAVPVGIIDTGIETDHEDITGRLYINVGEISGNGIDDDHNGFVDDVHGWDFSGDASGSPIDLVGDNDVSDQIGHGTHVAGTVAAEINNGLGIVAVSDSARVFAIKVFPNAYFSVTTQAVYYAVMRGARVINMSWGGAYPSRALEDALKFAHNQGVVLVASMGNSGNDAVFYPGAYPVAIGVGASTADDRLASFSTYNDSIDVVAPGQDILSLRAVGTDLYASGGEPGVHIIDNRYYIASGTSMAAPHVAGAAAAILSIAPGLSNSRVRQILKSTSDDILDPYGTGLHLPGFDCYTGWGRINLARAIDALPNIFVEITSPGANQWLSGTVSVSGSANGAAFVGYSVKIAPGHSSGTSSWTIVANSPTPVSAGTLATWNTAGLNGPHLIRLDAGPDAVFDVRVNLAQSPAAKLTSPISGQNVHLLATVTGTAIAPDFESYSLEAIGPLPAQTLHSICQFTRPVWDDTLGMWELDQLPSGNYWLRLTLSAAAGVTRDSVNVTVESVFHSGWPVRLPAAIGYATTTADIDGDGTEEIICPTTRGLWVLTPNGTSYPGWPRDTLARFLTPPAVADLDSDGKDEIIVAAPDSMYVYAFIGEQYAGWPQPFNGRDHLFGVTVPTVGNLDGQGSLEIVAVDSGGKINAWHEDGTPYSPLLTGFGNLPCTNTLNYSIPRSSICDLDGDGRQELIVAADGIFVFDGRTAMPYHGNGSVQIRSHRSTHGLAIGDFDRDGTREIAYIYNDVAAGNYNVSVIRPDGTALPGWPRVIPQTIDKYVLYSLTAGDVDGDGLPELFLAPYSLGDGFLYGYHANGAPLLSDSTNGLFTPLPGSASAVVLADINHDQQPEIVLRIGELLFGPDQIWALKADGVFEPGYPLTFGSGSSSIMSAPIVGDVDADGQGDMLTVQSTGTSVALWDMGTPYALKGRPWPRFQADNWNSGVIPSPVYDVIYLVRLIDMLYRNGSSFPPSEPTDLNCNDSSDLIDVVILINYIFRGGMAPCVP